MTAMAQCINNEITAHWNVKINGALLTLQCLFCHSNWASLRHTLLSKKLGLCAKYEYNNNKRE